MPSILKKNTEPCCKCGSTIGVSKCSETNRPVCFKCSLVFPISKERRKKDPTLPRFRVYSSLAVWKRKVNRILG